MRNVKKVTHPEFALRMEQACDKNPKVPPLHYGRLNWFVDQMQQRFGDPKGKPIVTKETIRKWFAGESMPRPRMIGYLSQILQCDQAWLALGVDPELTDKQSKARNAIASGAVNLLAGIIQMSGGSPAFPGEKDSDAQRSKIDLYAIIRGASYRFHVTVGERKESGWQFKVPIEADDVVTIGLKQVDEFCFEFVELPWAALDEHGTRRAGHLEVTIEDNADTDVWRPIKSFRERV